MAGWTAAEDAQLRELHVEGLPLNQVHRRMGRARSTVALHAKQLGLSWDRADSMIAPIRAAQMDRKVRRGQIIDRLYAQAEKIVGRLEDPDGYDALVNIGMGEQGARRLEFVPGVELRALSGSVSSLLAAAERLEKIDQDGGQAEVRGLVGTLMLSLDKIGETLPPVDEELRSE